LALSRGKCKKISKNGKLFDEKRDIFAENGKILPKMEKRQGVALPFLFC
jgi:hypothetical protein